MSLVKVKDIKSTIVNLALRVILVTLSVQKRKEKTVNKVLSCPCNFDLFNNLLKLDPSSPDTDSNWSKILISQL